MSDGGLAFGACIDQFPYESRPIKNIYLGPDYSDDEMEDMIASEEGNLNEDVKKGILTTLLVAAGIEIVASG